MVIVDWGEGVNNDPSRVEGWLGNYDDIKVTSGTERMDRLNVEYW